MVSRVNKFAGDIQRYLSVMTVINILVGLGDAILLWILGVDFALLWGIVAWFFSMIPYEDLTPEPVELPPGKNQKPSNTRICQGVTLYRKGTHRSS